MKAFVRSSLKFNIAIPLLLLITLSLYRLLGIHAEEFEEELIR